jgi:hypothetical protein
MTDDISIAETIGACVDSGYSPESLLAVAASLETRLAETSRPRLLEIAEELGRDPHTLIGPLREAADPKARREAAQMLAALTDNCACSGEPPPEPTFSQEEEATETLARRAIAPVEWLVKAKLL